MNTQEAVLAVIFSVAIAFCGGWWIGKSKAHDEVSTVASLLPDGCRQALREAAANLE